MSYISQNYTVESVTAGHPDKVCDQIADAILDSCLAQDSGSRVAVECFGNHGRLYIGGEVTTRAQVNYKAVAQEEYKKIGYDDQIDIVVEIAEQSPDIAAGICDGGAGDQGIMYGFACDETEEYLPRGVVLAHALTKRLEYVRKKGIISKIGPDGKAQVTMHQGVPQTVVVSTQHDKDFSLKDLYSAIVRHVIEPIVDTHRLDSVFINPAGAFTIGGFAADSGLTGRKIMVDTYGGIIPHGGGAFSGKDATKVDRSGAYMARFAAKDIVARGLAKECLVSVAYAIGKSEPVMLEARDEHGRRVAHIAEYDFRPQAIIERFDLTKNQYTNTTCYGHFGKEFLPWEKIVH